jgi:hypothetical protein
LLLSSVEEHPINWPVECQDLLEKISGSTAWNRYQIGLESCPNPPELPAMGRKVQRYACIHRHHLKDFIRRNPWFTPLKCTHLGEQTQVLVAGETIGAQANIEPKGAQFFEGKSAVPKIIVTARRMSDVKSSVRSFEQIEIRFRQFV